MGNNKLKNILDKIVDAKIISLNIDILQNKISFFVKIYINENEIDYRIAFTNVSAFYFVESIKEDNVNPACNDFYKLCSINYYKNRIGLLKFVTNDSWANQYYSSSNFIVTFVTKMLFIEAKTIQINDQIFQVGFPKI